MGLKCQKQHIRTPSGKHLPILLLMSCADGLLFSYGSLLGRVPCYAEFIVKQNLPHHNV